MVADGENVKITHLTGNLEFQNPTQIKKVAELSRIVCILVIKHATVQVLLPEYLYSEDFIVG